jgi:threonine/homoserine/homoserine lactone efflux protein
MITNLAAFLGLSALVIVTPGPDTALTVRNSLMSGRTAGFFTAAGICTGLTTWAVFTAAGVAALLRAWEPAFLAIRVAGGLYLAYLGLHGLIAALRRDGAGGVWTKGKDRRVSTRASYRQGLLSNLGNPKIAVFFISLLPQFSHDASFGVLLVLGSIFVAMTFTWLAVYVLLVSRAGDFLRRDHVRRWLDGISGLILVVLGLRIATERT